MPSNHIRRQLLDRIKTSSFPGSIIEVFKAADQGIDLISQYEQQQMQDQQMQVANTPQEQEVGLREQHAMGNTQASMAFPNVQPGQSFNTVGMKAPINIDKVDEQGHLVESYKNVPPGIQDLPTGPYKGTIIESPAGYQTGGVRRSKLISKIKGSRKGVQTNVDGSHSTHIMEYAEVDGKHHVYPTLFQDEQGNWYPGGYDEARRKGEIYIFDTEKEAAKWAGPNAPWKTEKYGPGYKMGGIKRSTGGLVDPSTATPTVTAPDPVNKDLMKYSLNFECDTDSGRGCGDPTGSLFRLGLKGGLDFTKGFYGQSKNLGPGWQDGVLVDNRIGTYSNPNVDANIGGYLRTNLPFHDKNWNPAHIDIGYNYNKPLDLGSNPVGPGTHNITGKIARSGDHFAGRPGYGGIFGNKGGTSRPQYSYGIEGNYDLTNKKLTNLGAYGQIGIMGPVNVSGSAGYNFETGKPQFGLGFGARFQKGGVRYETFEDIPTDLYSNTNDPFSQEYYAKQQELHGDKYSLKPHILERVNYINTDLYRERKAKEWEAVHGEAPPWAPTNNIFRRRKANKAWDEIRNQTVSNLFQGGTHPFMYPGSGIIGTARDGSGIINIDPGRSDIQTNVGLTKALRHEVGHRENAANSGLAVTSPDADYGGYSDYLQSFMKYDENALSDADKAIRKEGYFANPKEGKSYKWNIDTRYKDLGIWDYETNSFGDNEYQRLMDLSWEDYTEQFGKHGVGSAYDKGIGLYEIKNLQNLINTGVDPSTIEKPGGGTYTKEEVDFILNDPDRKQNIINFMNDWTSFNNIGNEMDPNTQLAKKGGMKKRKLKKYQYGGGSGLGLNTGLEFGNRGGRIFASPTYRMGNLDVGGIIGSHSTPQEGQDYWNSHGFAGGNFNLRFGNSGRNLRDYDTRFMGSLQGELGKGWTQHQNDNNNMNLSARVADPGGWTTEPPVEDPVTQSSSNNFKMPLDASARLNLGVGRPGAAGCFGGMCYTAPVLPWNISAFGEYGTKQSLRPNFNVGLSGRYGPVTGEYSYNVNTKQPGFKLGLNIPLFNQKR